MVPGHSLHITDLPRGDAQYVLPLRKQLKPRILQPLVGGGFFEARLQLWRRSALARNERMTRLPVLQFVLRVEIDRARTALPLILSVIVPLQARAAVGAGPPAPAAGPATNASTARTEPAIRRRMTLVCPNRPPLKRPPGNHSESAGSWPWCADRGNPR